GHVGVLPGRSNFTHGEERPVAIDLDRYVGVAHVALPELSGNRELDVAGGCSARWHLPDQREGNESRLVYVVRIGEVRLAVHDDPDAIAAVQPVGRDQLGVCCRSNNWRAYAAGKEEQTAQADRNGRKAHGDSPDRRPLKSGRSLLAVWLTARKCSY